MYGYGSYASLYTEKCHFLVFLASSRPSSPAFHFLGMKHWFMRAQVFKSYKMTSLWINSEYIKISLYTVYTVIRCTYGHIRHIYGIWKSDIRFGPTLHISIQSQSPPPPSAIASSLVYSLHCHACLRNSYALAHTHTHAQTYTNKHKHTQIHPYTCTQVHNHIHTNTFIHMHSGAQSHIHIHTLRWASPFP